MALDAATLARLDALQRHGGSGRAEYYRTLADAGDHYGTMALGVVLQSNMARRVAYSYAPEVGRRYCRPLDGTTWLALSTELMREDFAARTVELNYEPASPSLGCAVIRAYHARVRRCIRAAALRVDGVDPVDGLRDPRGKPLGGGSGRQSLLVLPRVSERTGADVKERRGAVYGRLRAAALVACCTVACARGVAWAAGDDGTTTVGGHVYRLPDGAFADGVVQHGIRAAMLLSFAVRMPTGGRSAAFADQIQVLAIGSTAGRALSAGAIAVDVAQTARAAVSYDHVASKQALVPAAAPRARLAGFVTIKTDDAMENDLFVRMVDGAPVEAIRCTWKDPARAVDIARCSDVSGWRGMLLTISYRREYLADWQKIQELVTGYLGAHEVGS